MDNVHVLTPLRYSRVGRNNIDDSYCYLLLVVSYTPNYENGIIIKKNGLLTSSDFWANI